MLCLPPLSAVKQVFAKQWSSVTVRKAGGLSVGDECWDRMFGFSG